MLIPRNTRTKEAVSGATGHLGRQPCCFDPCVVHVCDTIPGPLCGVELFGCTRIERAITLLLRTRLSLKIRYLRFAAR
jgi:hypothetical protein